MPVTRTAYSIAVARRVIPDAVDAARSAMRFWLPVLAVALTAGTAIADGHEKGEAIDKEAAGLWDDFNHYTRIARPDLAAASAEALLNRVDAKHLLAIVESSDYQDYLSRTMPTAERTETLRDAAKKLAEAIQAARVARSRDVARIIADISALTGSLRQRHNALERLRAAGQFAAPQFLDVLRDHRQERLHPHIETAMVEVGRELVYPLAVALAGLESVQMGQVARVLTQIGYPLALPYLKEVLERPDLDDEARLVLETGYAQLAASQALPADVTAAELFHTLGENYYKAGKDGNSLPGFDPANNEGIIWRFSRDAGLVPTRVPASVFADVLCMNASQRSLVLDPQMDPALSLWLSANLRRENNLADGEVEQATGLPLEPGFYARMAGPLRLHDVLDRSLRDADADLALDAILALRDTAGTAALINRDGAVQPLLRALTYPDRRVRFPAAFVMTQTRPTSAFPGSRHVVTVLAEAVRQSDLRHALAIAGDQATLNRLVADLKSMAYEVTAGLSLDSVADAINSGPGFDLIVTRLKAEQVTALYGATMDNYKLAAVPLLAFVTTVDQTALELAFKDSRRLSTAVDADDAEALRAAIEDTSRASAGRPITEDEAFDYASTALDLLHQVAVSESGVYEVSDAESTLIAALADSREPIVIKAGRVLALINSEAAQTSIADASLEDAAPRTLRVALLNSLAESARQYGNMLDRHQVEQLMEIVADSDGDLAIAAARAHGALTLPTSDVVEMITK